jgi:outer membrane protein assembly factor BamD (BamD/ComL family)
MLWHTSGDESEEDEWEQDQENSAQELFNKGSMAIEKGQFVDAKDHFCKVLETRLEFLPSTCCSYSKLITDTTSC